MARPRTDIADYLDAFEMNVKRRWAPSLARIRAEHVRLLMKANDGDDPVYGIAGQKPSLSEYDGHIETHGQD
jgi:hypothetical protein